jgi:hypothetical protein
MCAERNIGLSEAINEWNSALSRPSEGDTCR